MSGSHPAPDKDLQNIIKESFEEKDGESDRLGFRDDKAVINIIKTNKSAAEARYSYTINDFTDKYLPIFIAIRENASFDVIEALYRAYPGAAKEMIYDGNEYFCTLLHSAATYHNKSPKVVRLLLEEWPAASEVEDFCGETPLYAACCHQASLEVISLLLQHCPAAVEARDSDGETPLYAACSSNAPLEVISLLLEHWPAAVRIIDDYYGWTPLYMACHRCASLDVISLLLEQWPAAAEIKTFDGWTPLHNVCRRNSSLDVISLLLEHWPAAARAKDCYGETPLFAACGNNASLDVIALLLEHWPAAVKVKANNGWTALHAACNMDASPDVISLLLEYCPTAVEVKDNNGQTPHALSRKQKIMVSGISNLLKSIGPSAAKQIMTDFVDVEWWSGVWIFFDVYVDAAKSFEDIPLSVIPTMVSVMGNHCKLLAVWNMVRNRQDILKIN